MCHFQINSSLIPNSPLDRIPPTLKTQLQSQQPFIDSHAHIFNYRDVPTGYLGIRLPTARYFLGLLALFLHKWKGQTDRDQMSRYAYFLTTMKSRSSKRIYQRMDQYYHQHPEALYVLLTMDMDPAIKGHTKRKLREQLSAIARLRDEFPNKILPFVCIDPRREDALQLFEEAFDQHKDWRYFGLKVYPSLGFLPSHPRLMKMYEVCEAKNIPVLAHCSSGSTHGSKRKLEVEGIFVTNNGEWLEGPHRFKASLFRKKNSYRDFFNKPHHWAPVLDQFKQLKLNLAHFAGAHSWKNYQTSKDNQWISTIIALMEEYEQVYADFSYTLYSQEHTLKLKAAMQAHSTLDKRVLYGSDYYMLVVEGKLNEILARFKNDLGEELMHQLSIVNPSRYLFGR